MKILVADSGLAPHLDLMREHLATPAAVLNAQEVPDLAAALGQADVIVTSKFSAELAQQAPQIRLLHAAGVGTDGIDFAALSDQIPVATTSHHEDSIAEHSVMALIALQRSLLRQDALLRHGKWESAAYNPDFPQPQTLKGKVVTFLGFGAIGQATWSLMRHFGISGIAITGSGATDAQQHGLQWAGSTADLDKALIESDILIISIPLLPQTTGLIGSHELDLLGAQGLVVNVARGPIIDQDALFASLSNKTIAGAAIDVWYSYPDANGNGFPSSAPFASLDNVLMTPHASGVTQDTFASRALSITQNINRLVANEPLLDLVERP